MNIYFYFYKNKNIKKNLISLNLLNFFFILNIELFEKNLKKFGFIIFENKFNFLNFSLNYGIDGISLFFIILSLFLLPFCILCNWLNLKIRFKEFLILLIFLEIFLIMVFIVQDIILFYIFFELILIPMYFLIIIWGSRSRKILAANRFFLYTLFGSLLMLMAILYILYKVGSTNVIILYSYSFSLNEQIFLFFLFFFSILIKVPMVPLHIWLPEAHVEAPTSGSVILAGILLKLGGYALLRFVLPIFPIGCIFFKPLIYVLAIIGIIYPSLLTLTQTDLKKIIAYSSVAHMNLVIIGLFSNNLIAISGSVFTMLAHGIVSSALFLCIGMLYERTGTRLIVYYGGIVDYMPLFTFFFIIFIMSNMSVPLTANYIGEILILIGIFEKNSFIMILSSLGIILSAIYSIWLLNRVCFGVLNFKKNSIYSDLNYREFFILFPFFIITFFMGIFPMWFLNIIEYSLLFLNYYSCIIVI